MKMVYLKDLIPNGSENGGLPSKWPFFELRTSLMTIQCFFCTPFSKYHIILIIYNIYIYTCDVYIYIYQLTVTICWFKPQNCKKMLGLKVHVHCLSLCSVKVRNIIENFMFILVGKKCDNSSIWPWYVDVCWKPVGFFTGRSGGKCLVFTRLNHQNPWYPWPIQQWPWGRCWNLLLVS